MQTSAKGSRSSLSLQRFLVAFVGVLSSANGGDSRDGPAVSSLELLQETEVPEMLRNLLKALVRKPVRPGQCAVSRLAEELCGLALISSLNLLSDSQLMLIKLVGI